MSATARQPSPPGFPPGEGRQVLLVEDENRLREMLTRAIHEMGFVPTAAPQAESALRLFEQRGERSTTLADRGDTRHERREDTRRAERGGESLALAHRGTRGGDGFGDAPVPGARARDGEGAVERDAAGEQHRERPHHARCRGLPHERARERQGEEEAVESCP